ncbi:MAG: protoporphyrinogen oxidase [Acidimicrobiales bacterium]
MSGRPAHVVVVGGGVSGLTAALRLSQSGVEVTVVEADRLGGKLQTSMVAGRPVDEGADAFLLRVPWALALCHDLELDGELISPAERRAHVFVDGRRHLLPAAHVLGVPTDLDALGATGLITAAGVQRARRDLDLGPQPTDPVGRREGDDVAIGPFLRGRLGDEVVDHLVDPLVGGINAGDTATLSLAAVVPQLDAAARSGDPSLVRSCALQRERALAAASTNDAPIFATPIGGMARLIDTLLGFLPGVELRSGRRVVALEAGSSRGRAGRGRRPTGTTGMEVALDDGSTLATDAVVLAVPAHVAAPLLRDESADAADLLGEIAHASVSMLTLAFDRADLGDTTGASGCLIPTDQGALATAISYATTKWAQLRDPDRDDVILRVSAGRFGDDRHLDLDDAALTETVLADLDRVLGVGGDPAEVRVSRWPRSFPQYAPGHLDRCAAVEAALGDTPVRLAGMALRGVGIPACIRSGEDAAASLGATWPTRRTLLRPTTG